MPVKTFKFTLKTKGFCHLENITVLVQESLDKSGINAGIVCVSVAGSTAGISTIEYEPGLLKDIPEFFESLIPSGHSYHHDQTWGDGNGFSHLRSFLLKTSHTIPFADRRLLLGTWQQIVLADFDNRSRSREVIIQIVGE
jgi:secondary thiamine-phosphate synthase enzyme